MSDEFLRIMRNAVNNFLPQMASELLSMRQTGILDDGYVRAAARNLAEDLQLDFSTALSMVRAEIEFQALTKVAL